MKIVIPIVLVIAIVAGLAFAGIVNIPGVTPKKKKPVAAKTKKEIKTPELKQQPTPTPAPASKPKEPEAPKIVFDATAGQDQVATLWNEIDTPKLLPIVKDWKDEDLVKVFLKMDSAKVSEVLGAMDAKRASKLSKAIQDAASKVEAKE